MQQALSIALIITALIATSLPVSAHNAPSSCNVTKRAGGKRVYVSHVKDGAKLYLNIDGVQQKQIFHGPTATGSDGAITVTDANGTQICSG